MRCDAKVVLYDRASLRSRTPKSEAIKAEVRCTLQAGHDTSHAAMLDDTEPAGAILVWQKEK